MTKAIAVILVCAFSVILTVEAFSSMLYDTDAMELYESDTEETEKDLEDSETQYLVPSSKKSASFNPMDIKNHQSDNFLFTKNSHGEVNTPPPELRLA